MAAYTMTATAGSFVIYGSRSAMWYWSPISYVQVLRLPRTDDMREIENWRRKLIKIK